MNWQIAKNWLHSTKELKRFGKTSCSNGFYWLPLLRLGWLQAAANIGDPCCKLAQWLQASLRIHTHTQSREWRKFRTSVELGIAQWWSGQSSECQDVCDSQLLLGSTSNSSDTIENSLPPILFPMFLRLISNLPQQPESARKEWFCDYAKHDDEAGKMMKMERGCDGDASETVVCAEQEVCPLGNENSTLIVVIGGATEWCCWILGLKKSGKQHPKFSLKGLQSAKSSQNFKCCTMS